MHHDVNNISTFEGFGDGIADNRIPYSIGHYKTAPNSIIMQKIGHDRILYGRLSAETSAPERVGFIQI